MRHIPTKMPLFIGRPFVKRFALCYRTVVCPVCLSVLSVCDVGLLWPTGWMDQDATWYGGRPLPNPHCVKWGPSSLPKKGAQQPPTFRPMSIVAKRSPIPATAELLLKVGSLFHDLLLRFYLYHCVRSVITAHNLTPEKHNNNYSPHPLTPT